MSKKNIEESTLKIFQVLIILSRYFDEIQRELLEHFIFNRIFFIYFQ